MSLLTILFNLLALLYVVRAVQLIFRLVRERNELRQEPLTRAKQHLAEQAAFFVAVPPAVLVHESAHALAIWLFGGQVVEFGYRVFWGYVVPSGQFTAIQDWIIALAGTLGSLAFGAAVWLWTRRSSSRTVQYFGLRALRFQIYFSLLYYPVFSLFLPIGDWRTIYDFAATPVLSVATALAHAALLLWFWRADRTGAFEMPAFDSVTTQARHAAAVDALGDEAAQLQAIDDLRRGGATHQARRTLDSFLAVHPQSAAGHLQLALLSAGSQGRIGKETAETARRAVALGLPNARLNAVAHQLAATYELERGNGQAAEAEMDAALAAIAASDSDAIDQALHAQLHYTRAQAYRRQARYKDAYREADEALRWAGEAKLPQLTQSVLDEQQLIEKHAGRDLSSTLDRQPATIPVQRSSD